jgi:hypothetical protein
MEPGVAQAAPVARPLAPPPRARPVARVPAGDPLTRIHVAEPTRAPRQRPVALPPHPRLPAPTRARRGDLNDLFTMFPDLPAAPRPPRQPSARRLLPDGGTSRHAGPPPARVLRRRLS